MNLPATEGTFTRVDPTIPPNVNNPNFHCQSCKIKYKVKYLYRKHCREVYRIRLMPPQCLSDMLTDDEAKRWCFGYKKKFNDTYTFNIHMNSPSGDAARNDQSRREK